MSNPPPTESLSSRFPTRIHRLELTAADGSTLRTIDLLAPTDPDALLDDPIVEQRYKADNYLPYWPIIWPSGLMLATEILREGTEAQRHKGVEEGTKALRHKGTEGMENATPSPPLVPLCLSASVPSTPPRAIDLGCGLGITGIAAGLRGYHVTFTDYDPEAVEFAAHNALRNGIPAERVRPLHMDWREPVDETFPWVLASDVLYERRLHPLLLTCIQKLLDHSPDAQAWVSDPHRTSAEDFPLHAAEHGFRVTTLPIEGVNFAGGKQTGSLYILRWPK